MVESCAKFGGFSDQLRCQMMTIIAEIEKLEIQVQCSKVNTIFYYNYLRNLLQNTKQDLQIKITA